MTGWMNEVDWLRAGHPIEARPKELNRWFIAARIIWAISRVIFAWWPLWPVAVAMMITSPASLAITIPAVAVGAHQWPWYRARLRRGRSQTMAVMFRLYWPKACARAALVGIVDRHARPPRLVSVAFGPGLIPTWVRVTLQPLAVHPPAWWPNIADRLARELGYSTSTFHQGERRSDMILNLRRHVLPTHCELGTDTALDVIATNEDLVVFGESAEGGPFGWRPGEAGRANLILAGAQGGGKGNLARLLLAHCGRWGWEAIVLNPKGVGEFNWAKSFASICNTRTGMHTAIAYCVTEMHRRAAILDTYDADQVSDLPPEAQTEHNVQSRLVLIVDEIATFVALRGTTKPDHGTWLEAMNGLAQLASMGRALGVSLVVIPQHPIADNLGPNSLGSTLKANIHARIGTGNLEPEATRILFGATDDVNALALHQGIPGRCRFKGLQASDGPRDHIGQSYLAPKTAVTALTTGYATDTPDFDLAATDSGQQAA